MSTPPFKVKAVFDYASEHQDDLSFPNGQIITVTEEEDDEWYYGEYKNPDGITRQGMFPRNHVERFEPVTPPRPARHARKATESAEPPLPKPEEEAAPDATVEAEEAAPPPPTHEEEVVPDPEPTKLVAEEHVVPEPKKPETTAPETTTAPSKAPVATDEPVPSKKAPPPVVGKPSSSSFRDRIAAFNKPAAAPPAPLKPGGLSGGSGAGFIKKPYVPPPPSRDAYVPPPREPPRVAYHREEEVDRPPADAAAGRSSDPPQDIEAEDQPKPTSLKERIALLQKQQLEQAARHAEAAQKKEKPKRPPKKRTDSSQDTHEAIEPDTADAAGGLPRRTTADTEDDESPAEVRPPKRRTKSKEDDVPPTGGRELFSDTNDADQSAGPETEDGEHMSQSATITPILPKKLELPEGKDEDDARSAEDNEEGEEEEEEEEDPEIRRRMELRERMAKMSGGMGMAGMFGPPGGLPTMTKKKAKPEAERKSRTESNDSASAAPVPVMALPGMSMPGMHKVMSPPVDGSVQLGEPVSREAAGRGDLSDDEHEPAHPRASEDKPKQDRGDDPEGTAKLAARGAPPPPPRERPVPPPPQTRPVPPPPSESRPVPPVPPVPQSSRPPVSPQDSGSDDEDEPAPAAPPRRSGSSRRAPPVPPNRPEEAASPIEKSSPVVPAPPVPTSQPRAPPPPPPAAPPSQPRAASEDSESDEEEITEYEGDYDTDIAPNASHKDALTAHDKRDSTDDTLTGDETTSRAVPTSRPPPLPPTSPPRAVPPPPPAAPPRQPPSEVRREAPPPPPPVPKQPNVEPDDARGIHNENVSTPVADDEDDLYNATPPRRRSSGIADAPPPPHLGAPPLPPPKGSMEAPRETRIERRSTDGQRQSLDQGFIAEDVDLRRSSQWWTQSRTPPPSLQGRNDVTVEVYETSARQESREIVTKQVNVLYLDYSTTVITARFAADDPGKAELQQLHEPPPARLRQDQLEDAHSRYGPQIAEAAKSRTNSIVGNGTPFALIAEVLGALHTVPPVGSRAYGALIYANLANATIQQQDEIRTGDIISFRNAKLQGHRGAMSKKYAAEVGKPDHVGIVVDWDGTKKKVQVWEQGRESKKVKIESFKLGDLRSGEVKVWRAMPRSWVGWSSG